jgi:hypothetical protein
MGTRGWFALLHKRRYYRVFQSHDCYFSSLGAELEAELKSMDLATLLNLWRTLLDLAVIQGAMLTPPTEENALSEWNKCMKCLPSGPVSRWFSGDDEDDAFNARHLTEEHDPYLSRGDGCFIEYIYLVDMDNNVFSGLKADYGSEIHDILRFPLDTVLLPIFSENWAELMEESRAWELAEAFPLPGSVEEPLMESIAQHGYEVTKCIAYSRTAAVYRARCTRVGTPSDVVIKVFFNIGKDSTYMRPMAIADFLLSMPQHPHVVKIIEKVSFANCPSLVLEAYEGDLADLEVSSPRVKEDYVNAIVQAAAGLAFLHTKGIVHHDIKPKNILYRRDSNGGIEAAICDFESCCIPYIIDARWLELSWGPYEQAKTRVEARIAEDDVSDDSESDHDAAIENQLAQYHRNSDRLGRRHGKTFRAQKDPRWEGSYGPIRWTRKYTVDACDYYNVSTWAIDSISLATMLEELDTDNNDPVLRETSALLKNDPRISVDQAVSRLGQVGDLLVPNRGTAA